MSKPRLSFPQIWNMNFGFLGIQFGWGLQMANMSAIYTKLGAEPDKVAFLWLAAPMTGLLVQPIIGAMSDRTWNSLGRRRPYFLVGAILASLMLFLMPYSPSIWAAASFLWILDSSINISMEPFRAFVGDKLDESQRSTGFIMQSFFIGVGATLANVMPYVLSTYFNVTQNAPNGIPLSVVYSFRAGAVAFLGAVLWTVFTTSEYPPENLAEFRKKKAESSLITGAVEIFHEIIDALREMPDTMKRLAYVQVFTWLGLFCMWIFFGLTVSFHVFHAPDKNSPLFNQGNEWGGLCFAAYSVVCFIVAFLLKPISDAVGKRVVHAVALSCGGFGLLAVYFIQNKYLLFGTMVGVGIAWASILSMPYAILSGALPAARMGIYMGIFNFFIVIPEIVASLTFQPLVKYVFANNPLYVVMLGGASMLVAAALVLQVRDTVSQPQTVKSGAVAVSP
jgi:maltose/moltooligosaccharide transporter